MPLIPLPSGNNVEFREYDTLTRGDRKKILLATEQAPGQLSSGLVAMDELLKILIVGWSFERPLPSVSMISLDMLDIPDTVALEDAANEARAALFPKMGDPKDPASPPQPSGA